MKKLLKNIVSSIILIVVLASPAFCQDMVPKKDFDEVYNQLVISNEMLVETTNNLKNLTTSFDNYKAEYEKRLSDKDLEIENLKKKIVEKDADIDVIVSQLDISNETIKTQSSTITSLSTALENAKDRITESNLLLEKPKDFSLGVYAISSNFNIGAGVDFSYFIFKSLTIDFGAAYVPQLTFVTKIGLSYLW